MKIVINAMSARLGGGQTYLKNILDYLPDVHDLEILIFAPTSLIIPNDQRIRRGKTKWPTSNPILRVFWEIFSLPKVIDEEKADILFCPGGLLLSNISRQCQTVVTFQNMMPFDDIALSRLSMSLQKIRNFILKKIMLFSMRKSNLTIFISNHARSVIESLTCVRQSVTIPHGIGRAFRTHMQSLPRPAWLPAGNYLLYVSRFEVYKHHLEVVTAFANLPAELLKNYSLILVGEINNELARPIFEIIKAMGLGNNVFIVGGIPYDDLPAVYNNAFLNIFASSCENCPNIMLEALGSGRPLLSSNVAPMPEFGLNAAIYFSPTNPESIREAIQRALTNEELRVQLSAAAALRSAEFDWAETSRKTWLHIFNLIRR